MTEALLDSGVLGKQRDSSISGFGSRDKILPPPYLTNCTRSSFEGRGGINSPLKKNWHPSNKPGSWKI